MRQLRRAVVKCLDFYLTINNLAIQVSRDPSLLLGDDSTISNTKSNTGEAELRTTCDTNKKNEFYQPELVKLQSS